MIQITSSSNLVGLIFNQLYVKYDFWIFFFGFIFWRRRRGELCSFVPTVRTEGWWPPYGLHCATRPSVPQSLRTTEGNLFCHNMARGLSTLHLFVWHSLRRADIHVTVHARTHSSGRLNTNRKCGRNWQLTDGRLQRQWSGSNAGRTQDGLLLSCWLTLGSLICAS